jgi:hypothetical protein
MNKHGLHPPLRTGGAGSQSLPTTWFIVEPSNKTEGAPRHVTNCQKRVTIWQHQRFSALGFNPVQGIDCWNYCARELTARTETPNLARTEPRATSRIADCGLDPAPRTRGRLGYLKWDGGEDSFIVRCLTGIHANTSLAGVPQRTRTPRDQEILRASISDLLTPPVLTPAPLRRLPLEQAVKIYTSGIREKLDVGLLVPRRITDVTLSGATMNAGGAWLEVGGDGIRVYGDTGEIHWFKDPVPSVGAWMIVWLAGLEPGATYVGQIRGFTDPLPSRQYHIALKVVYPNRFEISYVLLTTKSFIVPFAFIALPQLTGITPHVQFFPEYLSHCVVHDVHVKKV